MPRVKWQLEEAAEMHTRTFPPPEWDCGTSPDSSITLFAIIYTLYKPRSATRASSSEPPSLSGKT